MNDRVLPTVRLDEKTLWKLHEKLGKLKSKENCPTPNNEGNLTTQRTRSSRAPKYQVYQVGVSRLSNRKLAPTFDQSTVEKTEDNIEEKAEQKNTLDIPTQDGDRDRRPQENWTSNSRGGNRRPRRTNYHRSENRRSKQGQQVKGQHWQNVAQRDKDSSDEVNEDDELAWDNYGESDLGTWSPQVTAGASSLDGGHSDAELYKDLSEDEKKPAAISVVKELHNSGRSRTNSEEDTPSAASSEPNKEYYKVAHTASSQSEAEYEEEFEEDYNDDHEFSNEMRKSIDRHASPVTQDPSKKRLFDPKNPNKPIVIKGLKGDRNEGCEYMAPTSGDNVYSPGLMREKLMKKIKGNRPRQTPRRPRSPPRYYGNYYPEDDNDDLDRRWMDPHSPTGNYRRTSEDLSEDDDAIASQMQSIHRQSCVSMLTEAERHEATLANILLTPSFDSQEYNESLTRVRNKLKVLYENIIVHDVETSSKHSIDQHLWRNVFYQVIEILREQIRACPEQETSELKINLILLLDQGRAFYENLLERLQQKYRFNLKDILNNVASRKKLMSGGRRRTKLSLLSSQRIFICLGDIARYREQANDSSNYGRAKHYYLQAQILAPKNGRPYNQLAVLAVKTRNKLDAVYYYVRSLAASNPILTARESLMVLFDEIRRRLEYVKRRKDEDSTAKDMANLKLAAKKDAGQKNKSDSPTRRWEEVWILPGSVQKEVVSASQPEQETSDFDELKLPPQDVAKHFVLLFLNAHGKLFTRIGLETFSEILTKTLRLFAATLEVPKIMTSQRMLQLYAINLFSVYNAERLSVHGSVQDSTQNLHQALRLTFSVFAVTIEQINKFFEFNSGDSDLFLSEHLCMLLPAVKIMFDWMYANKDFWYPPAKDLTEHGIDLWKNLAVLCNWICNHESTKHNTRIFSTADPELQEVFLPEDALLAGFSPLGQAFSDPRYVSSDKALTESETKSYVRQCVRINLIKEFLEYLCGMEEPLLAFKQGVYVPVTTHSLNNWSDRLHQDDDFDPSDYDFEDYSNLAVGNSFSEQSSSIDHDKEELKELKKYRDSLQVTKNLQEKRHSEIQSSLDSDEKVKLEICPKNLVPDTNCFIDHLNLIKRIIRSEKYKICMPLVVISELEGLATEMKGSSDHAKNVHHNAKSAIDFIKVCFASNNSRFCALTKRGTELNSLQFRSEDSQLVGSNDDFILQSAQGHSTTLSSKTDHVIEGMRIVRRSVVLLTDDRNLRLKALLLQDVPTKGILQFCKWAKI